MRDVLEASGYRIVEAADGPEALDIWKGGGSQIELLITDIIMPGGLNGWELADKLRAQQPGLKVILMSGYNADSAHRPSSRSMILQKPFTLEHLTETVQNCLGATCSPSAEISEKPWSANPESRMSQGPGRASSSAPL